MTIPAVKLFLSALAAACVIAAGAGCGRQGAEQASHGDTSGSPPPRLSELQEFLESELKRFGKDTSVAGAPGDPPQGPENAVFDLTATPLELAAPATGATPEGILLEWTERHVGDYDQNGVVTVADITPLASPMYWEMPVVYVDPRSEAASWPSSDGAMPAALYNPIWRLARVDGDSNGRVTLADITPIAKHFNEQCNGYRVLRKGPSDTEWVELAQDLYPQLRSSEPHGVVAIPRAATHAPGGLAPDSNLGVHYVLLDQSVSEPGEYEYYVQPVAVSTGPPLQTEFGTESRHFTVTYSVDPQPVETSEVPVVTLGTLGPASGDAPLGVYFLAQAESSEQISAVYWDYESDGTVDEGTGRQLNSQHLFEAPGHYMTSVYVLQPGGGSAVAQLEVDVLDEGNSLPVARLSAVPPGGPAPLTVTLDASASTDLEGIAGYEFDPLGDGNFTNAGMVPTFDYTYFEGEYEPAVRVRDETGATAIATVQLSVGPIDSEPPTLDITSSLTGGEYAPEVVDFTFSVSDLEGGEMTLQIDFEDDGIFDITETVSSGDYVRGHLYQTPGQHNLRARVTDDHTLVDEETVTFTLLENQPPTAQLESDVASGAAPLTVNFDASASSDPEGQPLSYFWDFEGDGSFVGPLTAQESFTYYEFGARSAWVRVVDSEGAFNVIGAPVTTTSGWELETILPAASEIPEVSMAMIAGHPAMAYHRNGTLYFARSDAADGAGWSVAVLVHSPEFGVLQPSLAEVNGAPAIAYLSHAGQLYYTRAINAQGSSWGPPLEVDFLSGSGAATDLEVIEGRPAIAWIDSLSQLKYVRATDADGDAWGATSNLGAHGDFVFNQEIDLDTVGSLPAVVASTGSVLNYHRALDADGLLWAPPQVVVADGTLRRAAALAVPPGLPTGVPTVLYYTASGMYSTRANDVTGSSWSAPVLISAVETESNNFITPEAEVEIVGGTLATLTALGGFHFSSDAFGSAWDPQFGLLDGNLPLAVDSYDLVDAGGSPVVALETASGLSIARLR